MVQGAAAVHVSMFVPTIAELSRKPTPIPTPAPPSKSRRRNASLAVELIADGVAAKIDQGAQTAALAAVTDALRA